MKARTAVTPMVLVALAGAAVGYAYLFDRTSISDADREQRRREVFPRFAVADVQRLTLERGGEQLVVEREIDAGSAAWAILAPRREPADPAAVEALLREMDLAIRLRDVSPAQAAGLDAPRVRGEVRVAGLVYRFALGGPAPVPEGASYMSVEGEGTFVVGRSLATELLRGADAYRDPALFPYGARDVGKLEVRQGAEPPGGGFVLVRSGLTFRLDDGARASRGAVERIFAALADAQARSFVPDEQADRSLASVATPLTIVAELREPGRPRIELRVGGACPEHAGDVVIVSLSPTRRSACVRAGAVEALREGRGGIVDEGVFYARKDEVAELRLESVGSPGEVLDLARRGTGWHERAPRDRDLSTVEADAANALAGKLTTLQAVEVLPPVPGEAAAQARSKVTLVRVEGATEVVEVEAGGLVRRADDGARLKMSEDAVRALETRTLPAPATRD